MDNNQVTDELSKRSQLTRSTNKPATIIFNLLFLGFGIFLVINSIQQHYETLNWPSVTAIVLSSYTDTQHGGTRALGRQCRDYLKVKYNVSNTEYISERIVWSGDFINVLFDKNNREAIMQNCIEGTQITLYYNPTDHYQFVLERGSLIQYPGRFWTLVLFAGLIFMFVPLATILCIEGSDADSVRHFLWNILINYKIGFVILFVVLCILF